MVGNNKTDSAVNLKHLETYNHGTYLYVITMKITAFLTISLLRVLLKHLEKLCESNSLISTVNEYRKGACHLILVNIFKVC